MSQFKHLMYAAFADELEKISNAGALVGGGVGWALSPNSIKGKVIGTALGAGAGHVIGAGYDAAKNVMWDQPQAQNRADVSNYIPVAMQQPRQGSNF